MAGKTLLEYNDVFADILNVLVFNGEQAIRPDELSDADNDDQLEAMHIVTKFLKTGNVIINLVEIIKQTEAERFMPLLVTDYDGQDYLKQSEDDKNIYPVITLVLYFGTNHWDCGSDLKDALAMPSGRFAPLSQYVSDYHMNLFEIAYLKPEQADLFKSDFKFVADYYRQMRAAGNFSCPNDAIRHKRATLELLSILTRNNLFDNAIPDIQETKDAHVGSALSRMTKEGYQKGFSIGQKMGIISGADHKSIIAYNNCLDRGMSEKDAIAISDISEAALKKARAERRK